MVYLLYFYFIFFKSLLAIKIIIKLKWWRITSHIGAVWNMMSESMNEKAWQIIKKSTASVKHAYEWSW